MCEFMCVCVFVCVCLCACMHVLCICEGMEGKGDNIWYSG